VNELCFIAEASVSVGMCSVARVDIGVPTEGTGGGGNPLEVVTDVLIEYGIWEVVVTDSVKLMTEVRREFFPFSLLLLMEREGVE